MMPLQSMPRTRFQRSDHCDGSHLMSRVCVFSSVVVVISIVCMCQTREQTIAPTVSLTKELEALYMFLVHQKATHSTADREYAGTILHAECSHLRIVRYHCCSCAHDDECFCVMDTNLSVAELAQLSEKELDAKVRELENWNFRLNLDEGASCGWCLL